MIGGDGINDESNKTRQPYCGCQLAETQKGHSPDSAAEGFLGRMKTESVYPEHWEECARDEVLVLMTITSTGTTMRASNGRLAG